MGSQDATTPINWYSTNNDRRENLKKDSSKEPKKDSSKGLSRGIPVTINEKKLNECWRDNPLREILKPVKAITYSFKVKKGTDGRYTDLLPCVYDLSNLILAYETIKSQPGNLTPGAGRPSMALDMGIFNELQER